MATVSATPPPGWELADTEFHWRDKPPPTLGGPLTVAIGMFDGVHLGHQAVIESAVTHARRLGGIAAVLTFDPHPSRLFRPDDPTRLLMPGAMKVRALFHLGVEVVLLRRFTQRYASITADGFLAHLKHDLPSLRSVHVGENFRFGRGRRGEVADLLASGRDLGVDVFSVDRIRYNGEPVSSSRLRTALETGEIEAVNTMLGYDYLSEGTVVGGAHLGRTIGFPTLNLPWQPELPPRFGVYAVTARDAAGKEVHGVANYGVRPTVATETTPLLEIHLLTDSTEWGEGAFLSVSWRRFLRAEKRFPNVDALRAQITEDKAQAAAFFADQYS